MTARDTANDLVVALKTDWNWDVQLEECVEDWVGESEACCGGFAS